MIISNGEVWTSKYDSKSYIKIIAVEQTTVLIQNLIDGNYPHTYKGFSFTITLDQLGEGFYHGSR
jgi:hypothetical protein